MITADEIIALKPCWGDTRLPGRFWMKVSPEPNSGCWLWMGAVTGHGYGNYSLGREYVMRMSPAHRVAYQALVSSVPVGLVLDHVCRTRCCVNPGHLRPVTVRDNTRAGLAGSPLTCRRGHSMVNAIARPNGRRACRACAALRNSRYRANLAAIIDEMAEVG